jgi:Protein of Unknown function (DUF2784)
LQGEAAELNVYQVLAVVVLTMHLGWIVWVIFGWVVTRNRPILRSFHILSLIYSILIENLPWSCPLTVAETRFEELGGIQPYHEPFLVHYLEALIYPHISPTLLTWCASSVSVAILGLYGLRFRRRRTAGW